MNRGSKATLRADTAPTVMSTVAEQLRARAATYRAKGYDGLAFDLEAEARAAETANGEVDRWNVQVPAKAPTRQALTVVPRTAAPEPVVKTSAPSGSVAEHADNTGAPIPLLRSKHYRPREPRQSQPVQEPVQSSAPRIPSCWTYFVRGEVEFRRDATGFLQCRIFGRGEWATV